MLPLGPSLSWPAEHSEYYVTEKAYHGALGEAPQPHTEQNLPCSSSIHLSKPLVSLTRAQNQMLNKLGKHVLAGNMFPLAAF